MKLSCLIHIPLLPLLPPLLCKYVHGLLPLETCVGVFVDCWHVDDVSILNIQQCL